LSWSDAPILFDPAHAIACARSFAQATGVGCLVLDGDGEILFEQRVADVRCDFCHRLGEIIGQSPACGQVHLYGCYQADRFGGQYLYYCRTGMVHFASPITVDGQLAGGLVGGPLLIADKEDYIVHDVLERNGLDVSLFEEFKELLACFVPASPERTRHLSDLLACAARDVSARLAEERRDAAEARRQEDDIHSAIQSFQKKEFSTYFYPLETERELLAALSSGDRNTARRLLSDLLGHIRLSSGDRLETVRARVLELLVLLSRAAMTGGADSEQVFFLNDRYLSEIDHLHSVEALSLWLSRIMTRFLRYVFDMTDIKHKDMMFKAADYMKKHYAQKLTLEEVAGSVYLSPSYFSKVFKETMGHTFNVYLNRLRIEKSKLLLLSGTESITDICDRVGFEDQSYFTKVFKKYAGMTPARYRALRGLSEGDRGKVG
jgi:AraC-like DNA-binding protein/ligand-binding sensor protein